MLNEINYVAPDANLGKIIRKNLRKEWCYIFDSIIKVFSGKIRIFDTITSVIQEIAYGFFYNHLCNLGDTIINEIGVKLGNIESRTKNVYYDRFTMLTTIHVAPSMVLDHPENQLSCWIHNKRLFKDLMRINLHEGIELRYPQVIQVYLSTKLPPLSSLPSNAAMEGVNDPNPPSEAAKPKRVPKKKSKTPSIVSQNTSVETKTKSQPEGSEHLSEIGEGIGDHRRTHKYKASEGEKNQPRNHVST